MGYNIYIFQLFLDPVSSLGIWITSKISIIYAKMVFGKIHRQKWNRDDSNGNPGMMRFKFDMIRSFRRYMSYMQTCLFWSMSLSQQRNAPIQFDFLLITCRSQQLCGKDSRKWFVWVKVQGPKSGAHIDFQYHSQWKRHGCFGYVLDYTTHLCRDDSK